MTFMQIPEESLLKRAKIKKDLRNILKRHGFKRSFFGHPASEVYVKGDFKAKVYSKTEHDFGSKRYKISPHDYGVAGVKIDGPIKDSKFDKTKKELHAYFKKWGDEKFIKKPEQKTSGLEKRIGVFIAFTIGGVALSLGSLSITGNVISNLTGTSLGLFGIFLFIAGLVGMFFYSRRK